MPAPPASNPSQHLAHLNEQTWFQIGRLSETLNDIDRAVVAFENVLRYNPQNSTALIRCAVACKSREHYTKAVDYFSKYLKDFDQQNGEHWGSLAHCHLMLDELQKAYNSYQRALYFLPNPKDPQLWYGIGILYDRYGSYEYAEEAFTSVISMDPKFEKASEIYFRLGIIYKQQQKYSQSLECFRYVLSSPPKPLVETDIWFQIGLVYEQQKEFLPARDAYERVLKENPNHAKVLQQMGWLYHQPGTSFCNQDAAIQFINRSLEFSDNQDAAQSHYLLGRCFMAQQRYSNAYHAFQQAINLDNQNPAIWCSIGALYYQRNQYRDALDAYSRAICLNPYLSEVWYDIGTLYEACHDQVNDAIDAYSRALELDPNNQNIKQRLQALRSGASAGQQPRHQPLSSDHSSFTAHVSSPFGRGDRPPAGGSVPPWLGRDIERNPNAKNPSSYYPDTHPSSQSQSGPAPSPHPSSNPYPQPPHTHGSTPNQSAPPFRDPAAEARSSPYPGNYMAGSDSMRAGPGMEGGRGPGGELLPRGPPDAMRGPPADPIRGPPPNKVHPGQPAASPRMGHRRNVSGARNSPKIAPMAPESAQPSPHPGFHNDQGRRPDFNPAFKDPYGAPGAGPYRYDARGAPLESPSPAPDGRGGPPPDYGAWPSDRMPSTNGPAPFDGAPPMGRPGVAERYDPRMDSRKPPVDRYAPPPSAGGVGRGNEYYPERTPSRDVRTPRDVRDGREKELVDGREMWDAREGAHPSHPNTPMAPTPTLRDAYSGRDIRDAKDYKDGRDLRDRYDRDYPGKIPYRGVADPRAVGAHMDSPMAPSVKESNGRLYHGANPTGAVPPRESGLQGHPHVSGHDRYDGHDHPDMSTVSGRPGEVGHHYPMPHPGDVRLAGDNGFDGLRRGRIDRDERDVDHPGGPDHHGSALKRPGIPEHEDGLYKDEHGLPEIKRVKATHRGEDNNYDD